MKTDPKLESYLASLHKALGSIPISDRADIITEIKSHILLAQEKDPSQSLNTILASLGEPETVANRYLLERGLKPGKPSKSPMVKWLTIGFLGTFAMICLTLIVLVRSFTPLISVDEEQERVILLGGVIDVDGKAGNVKIGPIHVKEDKENQKFEGSIPLDSKNTKEIKVKFKNGKFEVSPSLGNEIRWDCKVAKGDSDQFINDKAGIFSFNFEDIDGVKCDLKIPKDIKFDLVGANGKLDLENPQAETTVTLTNGKVHIDPDKTKKYKYDLKVTNGVVAKFLSSEDKDAIQVRVHMANGKITSEEQAE